MGGGIILRSCVKNFCCRLRGVTKFFLLFARFLISATVASERVSSSRRGIKYHQCLIKKDFMFQVTGCKCMWCMYVHNLPAGETITDWLMLNSVDLNIFTHRTHVMCSRWCGFSLLLLASTRNAANWRRTRSRFSCYYFETNYHHFHYQMICLVFHLAVRKSAAAPSRM